MIAAVVDPFGTVDEIYETNNSLSKSLVVRASTRPDLTVSSSDISFEPSQPVSGGQVSISARVSNLRNTLVSNLLVNFYDGNPASGGVLIGSSTLPSISGLGSETAMFIWNLSGISGKHLVYVKVDPNNAIVETNETNNEASAAVKIRLPQSAAPVNLAAAAVSSTDIELTWQQGSEADAYGITGYNIYRNGIWANSLLDISRQGTASASSMLSSSYSADKAVDGNVNTAWYTAANAPLPQWWQEEFASPRSIRKVAVSWQTNYFGKNFQIQTWDGMQWVTQATITGNTKAVTVHDFTTTVTTDKIRIYVTVANSSSYPASILEVDVYEDRTISATIHQDRGLGAGNYTYYATAVDVNGVESLPSNDASASLGDITPPAAPSGLAATVSGFNINIGWPANSESDLSGYRVYRDNLNIAHKDRGAMILGTNGSSHDSVIDGNAASSGYTQWDTNPQGTMTITLGRIYELSQIRLLLYETTDNRFYRFKVESSICGKSWQTIMDKTSGEWRGWQSLVFSQPVHAKYFRITGTFSSADNYFRVSEFEAYSPEMAPRTLDTSVAMYITVSNYSNFYEYTYDWNSGSRQPRKFVFSEFNLEEKDLFNIYDKETGILLASYTGNLGAFETPLLTATNYRFQFVADHEGTASGFKLVKHISLGKQTTRTYTETNYQNGAYKFAVTAIDTSGNESGLSNIATPVIADTTPPAVPRNLAAAAGNRVVDLTWTANIEADRAGYNLYRNDHATPLNGATPLTSTSYKDLDVVNLTAYTYRITAVDVNGNESAKSAIVTATPTGVDLTIYQSGSIVDLFIFPQKPTIFDTATITALVKNAGTDSVENVKVNFYDGDPGAGGALIGTAVIQKKLGQNETEMAQILWDLRTAEGAHTVYAAVDPDNSIPELVETNNRVFKQFIVTTTPVLTVDFNTVSATSFPGIEAKIRVRDANDNGIFGLNENNFIVTENGLSASPITVTALTDPQKRIPKVDIAFIVDTSGSMGEEWQTLCGVIDDVVELLSAQGIDLSFTMYGLAHQYTPGDCSTVLSQVIYNNILKSAHEEDWGPGTTWAAKKYPWREGAARIVIPISDENAYAGTPETQEDLISIQEAIEACTANQVIAYPFYSYACGATVVCPGVKEEAEALAAGTGGMAFLFQDANQVVNEIIKAAKRSVSDYQINYVTPNPARDGALRNVVISASYSIASGAGTGQYRAPSDSMADLTIGSLALSNEHPLAGEIVGVSAEVRNLGGVEARDILVRFYEGYPEYGIQLGGDQIIANLLPAGTTTVTAQWQATPGVHRITVIADPLNAVVETDEENNTAYRTLTVPGAPLPELGLHVNDIVFSKSSPSKGERITITATVHNAGEGAINVLVLTSLGDPRTGGVQLGASTVPYIGLHGTAVVETEWSIDRPEGTYDIHVWVDPYNTVVEGNEDDNIASRAVTVLGKSLSAEVVTDRPQYAADSNVSITVAVRNESPALWSGNGEVSIEDPSGSRVAGVSTFNLNGLKPVGLKGWAYRIPAHLTAVWDMRDTLAQVDVDFTAVLTSLGLPDKTIDKNSIRVLELDTQGALINEKQAQSRFMTDTAAGITWLMDGITSSGSTRYFFIYFDVLENGAKTPPVNTRLPSTGRLIAFSDDTGRISIIESSGDGAFGTSRLVDDVSAATDNTRGIVLDDFNGDGFPDIVTGSGSNGEIYFYQNRADGTNTFFAKVKIGAIASNSYIMDMATADFNKDGKKDFVMSGNMYNQLYLFTGQGDGTFVQTSMPLPTGTHYFRGKATADTNSDGYADLIVANNGGAIYVYKGKGDGSFLAPVQIANISAEPYGLAAGDFDGDSKVDIIVNKGNTGDGYLLKGNGDGTYGAPALILSLDTNNVTAFDAGDFNSDGRLDIIAATYTSRTIEFFPGKGDGTFEAKRTITTTGTYNTLGISSSPALPEARPATGSPETAPAQTFEFVWNTGSTASGNYMVHVTLSEGQGVTTEDYASFEILPDIKAASMIVTDKISYRANENVTVTSTVTSMSRNYGLENLLAKVLISRQDTGEIRHKETRTLAFLNQGQTTTFQSYWNAGQHMPGAYAAALEVSYGGQVISSSSAAFTLLDTAATGDGLSGTISANPASVEAGQPVTISNAVTNTGNADISGAMVKVLVVDPETGTVSRELTRIDANINKGGTLTDVQTASTAGLAPKNYLAVLQVQTEAMAQPKTLASAVFEVKAGIEVTKKIPDVTNLLVWINDKCERSGNSAAETTEDTERSNLGRGLTPDSRVRGQAQINADEEKEKKCMSIDLIEEALRAAVTDYTIVHDKKEFEQELRNPSYTDIMILGDHHPIEDHFSEELREQVYSGKGFISSLFNRQSLESEVFGIKVAGSLPGEGYIAEFQESELGMQGSFPTQGRVLKAETDDLESVIAWISVETKKGEERHPAAIARQYGKGKVLFFAFDLGRSSANEIPLQGLLVKSLEFIHQPLDPAAIRPNRLVPVEIELKSLGGVFEIRITETYPEEVKLYDPEFMDWLPAGTWTRDLHLEPGETKTIRYCALAPDEAGTYTLNTEVGYIEAGEYIKYQDLSTDLVVQKDSEAMTGDIIRALQGLDASKKDQPKIKDAVKHIEKVMSRAILEPKDIKKNIHDLLKAVGALLSVTSADVSGVRLLLDDLLVFWEAEWYLQGGREE